MILSNILADAGDELITANLIRATAHDRQHRAKNHKKVVWASPRLRPLADHIGGHLRTKRASNATTSTSSRHLPHRHRQLHPESAADKFLVGST